MEFEQVIFELKRLADIASEHNFELAEELYNVINQYEQPKGECCG